MALGWRWLGVRVARAGLTRSRRSDTLVAYPTKEQAMTLDELVLRLQRLAGASGDPERTHIEADELLLDYIDSAPAREAFESILKWYA